MTGMLRVMRLAHTLTRPAVSLLELAGLLAATLTGALMPWQWPWTLLAAVAVPGLLAGGMTASLLLGGYSAGFLAGFGGPSDDQED